MATTSGGVAEALGFEDGEAAPAEEMLGAAARIAGSVDAPVTVDAEGGYGMEPAALVDALHRAGVAGCNLEDTDHSSGRLKDPDRHSDWLGEVRKQASDRGYPLVINARVDVFLADRGTTPQENLVDEAVRRARSYRTAGADCVYPIFLRDEDAVGAFVSAVSGPVNILAVQQAPPNARLAEMGVARISYGSSIQHRTIAGLSAILSEIERPD